MHLFKFTPIRAELLAHSQTLLISRLPAYNRNCRGDQMGQVTPPLIHKCPFQNLENLN